MDDFVKVAEIGDLKEGQLFPFDVEGEPICLAMVEGHIYAFTDNCTHISGPLNEGGLDNCSVMCPWHGAQFDIRTGQVLRGPARQDLVTYPVRVTDDGSVFINLPPAE